MKVPFNVPAQKRKPLLLGGVFQASGGRRDLNAENAMIIDTNAESIPLPGKGQMAFWEKYYSN